MKPVQSFLKAAALIMLLSTLVAQALAQNGAVSGTATAPQPSNNTPTTAPAAGDAKPLPWKFLAKPMGAIDSIQWTPFIHSFTCNDAPKCPMPDETQLKTLFGLTIGNLPESQSVYVIVHVVEYPVSSAANPEPDHWYLYHRSQKRYGEPKWSYTKFTGQRIYGASPVYFLFLHLNAGAITLENATRQAKQLFQLANTSENKSADAATNSNRTYLNKPGTPDVLREKLLGLDDPYVADGIALNALTIHIKEDDPKSNVILKFCEATRDNDQFDWSLGHGGISSRFKSIRYEAAVVKRTPANVDHLKQIFGLLLEAAAQGNLNCLGLIDNDILWGAARIVDIGLPSDISIAGYAIGNDADVDKPVLEADRVRLQIGTTGSYNDEQLYWWDASIGIPVHKIKDLQYSDIDNTVTAAQVDKQSAYAMFNLMLVPVDLSDAKDNWKPRILAGFPLASSPWDKLFAGGAVGLPFKPFQNFQFFVGATFIRSTKPATLAAGNTATSAQLQNDLKLTMIPKLTIGINVPVKSVIDKLKK